MQEDKLDKWLASSLKRAQEQAPISYEEGAWEAFEKKRQAKKIKAITYWVSGVAASLIILLVAFNSFDFQSQTKPEMLSLGSSADSSLGNENPTNEEQVSPENQVGNSNSSGSKIDLLADDQSKSEGSKNAPTSQSKGIAEKRESSKNASQTSNMAQVDNPEKRDVSSNAEDKNAVVTNSEMANTTSTQLTLAETQADSVEAAKVELLKKQIADLTGDKEEVKTQESSPIAMALGVSPGYGTGQQENQSVMSSSIGLGVQMNLDLGKKLTLGSGMGLNYFNQTSEGEGVVRIANASYPGNERTEIQQVQMDIPVFVTYAITRNKSISIQAGFSNLVAFNQSSQREFLYTRQVSVVDAQSALANSVSFKNESVANLSTLDTPSSKFYPFATANLGINIRLLESKKTSYLLMPFYNYPIQDITATGTNIGFFGAALKVNFGNIQKK
ncbi:outer membrane protein with beta-barrel domain [Algoriphagus boseongensis]|uniref:Outer membrane protein with beta-barrel domain n=1 Tax=Algoriphagus boseongensis TaxID=1442587 RepID=A0A4R6TCL7_9BACT|nr:outer membrane beta-barrel protein [Algoriphagus boseongensis]TDQ19465.1 outer membrane protein with beta-barrel domain [Algoriphagus boseongensis]